MSAVPVPMEATDPPEARHRLMPDGTTPRCQARSSQHHGQCQRASTPGTTVCASHGSRAPQVKRRAALRLLELVEPAIATLGREMTNPQGTPMSRLRAAENVLDRIGIPRRVDTTSDDARAMLVQKLREMAEATVEGEAVDVTDLTQPLTPEILP